MMVWARALAAWLLVASAGCGAASRPLPRLERYDFLGETPTDLAGLRQMASAEGPEGPVARYAMARAHADWLVLGLVRDRDDDQLLRRLAVDLGVAGASPDDRLGLEQLLLTFDAVLAEIETVGAAGPEARAWASATSALLRGVRLGWEQFGVEVFRALDRASERPGPARVAADLLAVGWGRLALAAASQRPSREQAAMLARIAGYHDPGLVTRLDRAEGDLLRAVSGLACEPVRRQARRATGLELLELVRGSCSADDLGVPEGGAELASAELVVMARILDDLLGRRRRLAEAGSDPLVQAAGEDLARFDELVRTLRLAAPLPVPGPRTPRPPVLRQGSTWRPATAVVTVAGDERSVALWPVLGLDESGRVALLDRQADLSLPGRSVGDELTAALRSTWSTAARSFGTREHTVAVVAAGETPAETLIDLVARCEEAGASRVELVGVTRQGAPSTLPVHAGRGAGRSRSAGDTRAIVVLEPDGVLVGDADDRWTEVQDGADGLALTQLMAALGQHLAGRGTSAMVVAVRPGVDLERLAGLLEVLAPLPEAPAASPSWRVWLDDREPPAPERAAATVAETLSAHRIRLRDCYEQFIREGGEGEGLLVVELAVDPEGRVTSAEVIRTELGRQPGLESCLVGAARRIRFPGALESRTVHVPLRLVPRRD